MKRLLVIVLIVCLFIPASSLAQTLYTISTVGQEVNIRERADVKSLIIGYTTCGDTYDYTEEIDGFFFCPDMGTETGNGYVSANYLSITEPIFVENIIYVTNKRNVFLRECPNGEKIAKLKKGIEVEVIMTFIDTNSIEWAKTPDGYIMMKYLDEKVVEISK